MTTIEREEPKWGRAEVIGFVPTEDVIQKAVRDPRKEHVHATLVL